MRFLKKNKEAIDRWWRKKRREFLCDAHTKEKEIKMHYTRQEYFDLDGKVVWMPTYLQNSSAFYKSYYKYNIKKYGKPFKK